MKYLLYLNILKNNKNIFFEKHILNKNICLIHANIHQESNIDKILNKNLSNLFKSPSSLLDKIDIIYINPKNIKPGFIKNNNFFKNKKIYILGKYSLNFKDYDYLYRLFGEFDNVFVYTYGNFNPVSLQDYKKTIDIISQYINKVNMYNASPIEKLGLIFDLVRDRIYKSDKIIDDISYGRDITKVLLGKNIVCTGFANLFSILANMIGIRTKIFYVSDPIDNDKIHALDMAYVIDKKYNINGVYFFDPTLNSRYKKNNNDFLNSYKYFCMSRDELDTMFDFVDITLDDFSKYSINEFEYIIKNEEFKNYPGELINMYNKISLFIDRKCFIYDTKNGEDIIASISKYQSLFFDNEITGTNMFKIIYNIRKFEYYLFPFKYSFNIETFKKIFVSNTISDINKKFKYNSSILDSSLKTISLETFNKYITDNSLDKEIELIKLTKTLRKNLTQ